MADRCYKTECQKDCWIPKCLAATLGLFGWEDNSWSEEGSASFEKGDLYLYCHEKDRHKSGHSKRYWLEWRAGITLLGQPSHELLLRTNSTAELIAWLWENP